MAILDLTNNTSKKNIVLNLSDDIDFLHIQLPKHIDDTILYTIQCNKFLKMKII